MDLIDSDFPILNDRQLDYLLTLIGAFMVGYLFGRIIRRGFEQRKVRLSVVKSHPSKESTRGA